MLLSVVCCFSLLGVCFSVIARDFASVPISLVKPLKHFLVFFLLFTLLAELFFSEYDTLMSIVVFVSFLFCFLNRLVILASSGGKIGSFLRHSGEWGFLLLKLMTIENNSFVFVLRTTSVVTVVGGLLAFAFYLVLSSDAQGGD